LKGLGIVAALAVESRPLGVARRRRAGPASLADGTLLVVSGMGPAAAGRGARQLVEAGARALISWGMAGGLDPALTAGTLLLPGEIVSRDGALFPTAREWRERLSAAVAGLHPVCGGRLLTCAAAIGSVAEKASAFRETTAIAVDMESLAVAQVAASHGLPFIAVRAIVDTAADALPRTLVAVAAEAGAVRLGHLLAALARRPADLGAFIRLVRPYRAAKRALASVARCGALAPRGLRIPSDTAGP